MMINGADPSILIMNICRTHCQFWYIAYTLARSQSSVACAWPLQHAPQNRSDQERAGLQKKAVTGA